MLLLGFQQSAGGNSLINNGSVTDQGDTIRNSIPYTLPWDDMPIDLSFVYAKEKPAGKHGFLKVEGDRFIFEDGTEARFWGTNFNSAQNFPSHEHSEKVAKRLAKIGVNIVRFHQLDAEWSTPNIFQFTKGENKTNTMSFDPVSIDRLDYLIHCLKDEGVYVYLDLLTYRRFKSGDGVEATGQLKDAAKPYSTYNRRLIELQKKFNYDLWTHINPFTGLAYKDDPAIALSGVTNENSMFLQKVTQEPYRTELIKLYRKWSEEKGIKINEEKIEFNRSDLSTQPFLIEVQKEYFREMIKHMRELGVKIPITGINNTINLAYISTNMVTDFDDSHAYWYNFGLWRDGSRRFRNDPMTGSASNMLTGRPLNKVSGRPVFISEWDNAWPNEWRAESSLLMAAVGALQGWSGFTIHTYRYSLDEHVDMIGKPITSNAIGGSYYRGGSFDTFNDPAKFGLFYHAALLLRRGDVKPAEKTVAVKIEDISSHNPKSLNLTPEKHRIVMVLPGEKAKGDMIIDPDETVVDNESGEVLSDTKELYRNINKKFGWIDTPDTKAVYGFLGKEGNQELTDLALP